MRLGLALLLLLTPAVQAQEAEALSVTVTPWVEMAFSSRTEGSRTTAGGQLRFDGYVPVGDPERYRLRVDINIAGNASATPGEFSFAAPATWGRYAEVLIAGYGRLHKANGVSLGYYVGWGFQTAVGNRERVADRFFRSREIGARIADRVGELVIAYDYDDRLPNRHGLHLHGRVPVPGTARAMYLMGDALLGIGGKGGDQLMLRIGVDLGELMEAVR